MSEAAEKAYIEEIARLRTKLEAYTDDLPCTNESFAEMEQYHLEKLLSEAEVKRLKEDVAHRDHIHGQCYRLLARIADRLGAEVPEDNLLAMEVEEIDRIITGLLSSQDDWRGQHAKYAAEASMQFESMHTEIERLKYTVSSHEARLIQYADALRGYRYLSEDSTQAIARLRADAAMVDWLAGNTDELGLTDINRGKGGMSLDGYAFLIAEEDGRSEPNAEDEREGFRRMVRAAMEGEKK